MSAIAVLKGRMTRSMHDFAPIDVFAVIAASPASTRFTTATSRRYSSARHDERRRYVKRRVSGERVNSASYLH